jgi:hypothetical protein
MKKYLVLAILVASLMLVYVVNLYLDLPSNNPEESNPTTQNLTEQTKVEPKAPAPTQKPSTVTTPSAPVSQPDPTSQAMIDSVIVEIAESFPPQYFANIKGNFRNGCESLGDFGQSVSGNTVTLNIGVDTQGEMCAQALVPFNVKFPVNAANLTKGTYTLQVNNQSTTFDVQ